MKRVREHKITRGKKKRVRDEATLKTDDAL